jgi:copper chaperone CopZ
VAVQKLFIPALEHETEPLVEATLSRLEGVLFVAATHVDRCAEVEFDDDVVTTDAMRQALRSVGLEARLAG